VAVRLHRHDPESYRAPADALSKSVDAVLIEHEFRIFGGRAGHLPGRTDRPVAVPFALTLHTVTGSFTDLQRRALPQPLQRAAAVVVFRPRSSPEPRNVRVEVLLVSAALLEYCRTCAALLYRFP